MKNLPINSMKIEYVRFSINKEGEMEITITELVQNYGLDSVLIAVAVCILTGLIKMPIKKLASKAEDPSKYTKYITFLPLLIGFGVTVLYEYIITKSVVFSGDFITLWLTSSSLSLAIYAFIEKFIPSKKKISSAEEMKQNEEMLDTLKEILTSDKHAEGTENIAEAVPESTENAQKIASAEINTSESQVIEPIQEKIILRGRKND